MNEKPSIAVVILTYNEALHLQRALDHVRSFAHEIFVIDSFSTDNTVELARAGGANVVQHSFQYQAQQFNWALENVPISSDWVMRLDADGNNRGRILPRRSSASFHYFPPEVTGVNLNRKTIFQGKIHPPWRKVSTDLAADLALAARRELRTAGWTSTSI